MLCMSVHQNLPSHKITMSMLLAIFWRRQLCLKIHFRESVWAAVIHKIKKGAKILLFFKAPEFSPESSFNNDMGLHIVTSNN